MSNRWLIDRPQNVWSSIASISHWLHLLVIDFIYYSSISSRGCKRIWRRITKLKLWCEQIFPGLWKLSFRRFSSISLPFVVELHLDVAPSRLISFANCTIENHLYLWLALCVSTSSIGTSDTRKNVSNTDKRITNEKKMVQESRKSVLCAQHNSRWVIDVIDE